MASCNGYNCNIYSWVLIIIIVILIFWWLTQPKFASTSIDHKNTITEDPEFACCQYTPPDGHKAYIWGYRQDCQPDDAPKRKNFTIIPCIKSKSQCKACN